jgi:hypothetical protein
VGENVGDLVMSGKEALNVPRRLDVERLAHFFGFPLEHLPLRQSAERAVGGDQFWVTTALDEPPLFENEYPVSTLDRAQAMGNNNARRAGWTNPRAID